VVELKLTECKVKIFQIIKNYTTVDHEKFSNIFQENTGFKLLERASSWRKL
jgi:hypothetical protein